MAKKAAGKTSEETSAKDSPAKRKAAPKAKAKAETAPAKPALKIGTPTTPEPPPGPAKKPKFRKPGEIPAWFQAEFPDAKELAFLLAVMDDPEDRTYREVYANWLEERGSPRGEFLRLERQSESLPSEMLSARLNQLRSTLSPIWLCAIGDTLAGSQSLIQQVAESDGGAGYHPRLEVATHWGLLDVHYFGDLLGEIRDEVLLWVASREIGPIVRSLVLDGHEDRSRNNGTLDIDLRILVDAGPDFRSLTRLELERGTGAIAVYHDPLREKGLFAKLLRKSPHLEELIIPSAPSSDFFAGPAHPLAKLVVDAGYDHQNFVRNLAFSTRFPLLRSLEYQDYCQTNVDDWKTHVTPVESYEALFRGLARVERIVIRSASLTAEEIKRLKAIRKTGVKFEAVG